MTGNLLREARRTSALTQQDAAAKLGVTQAYLSMVERGERLMSAELAARVVEVLDVAPTAFPLGNHERGCDGNFDFHKALGSLGYPGFAYLGGSLKLNPAEVLMRALDSDDLDSRVTEAMPWLVASFPTMDWEWVLAHAKLHDRQNRLAYVTALASEAATAWGDSQLGNDLSRRVVSLEKSRLAAEDTLCKESMTQAERVRLRNRRSPLAAHWNLLSDLTLNQVDYAPI